MAKPVTKRFSTVRYWRYVFTPILFLLLFIGISLLYTSEGAKGIRVEGAAGLGGLQSLRQGSFSSLVSQLDKLRS